MCVCASRVKGGSLVGNALKFVLLFCLCERCGGSRMPVSFFVHIIIIICIVKAYSCLACLAVFFFFGHNILYP